MSKLRLIQPDVKFKYKISKVSHKESDIHNWAVYVLILNHYNKLFNLETYNCPKKCVCYEVPEFDECVLGCLQLQMHLTICPGQGYSEVVTTKTVNSTQDSGFDFWKHFQKLSFKFGNRAQVLKFETCMVKQKLTIRPIVINNIWCNR